MRLRADYFRTQETAFSPFISCLTELEPEILRLQTFVKE